MARLIAALAVLLAIMLAINWCHGEKEPVRDPKKDCHHPSYKEKMMRLCGSTSTKQHSKLIRQTEPGEKIDERHHRYHHHHKKYRNHLEPTGKDHIAPVNITTIVPGNEKKNNNSYFEESLFIWYLNPVKMGSEERYGEDTLSASDRGTYGSIRSRNGETFAERWRRHPSMKKLVMEFFENTCCQKGCFFPDDFSELMEKIC